MKKALVALAVAGMLGGTGVAVADTIEVAGLGWVHASEGGVVIEGNESTIEGYLGVESSGTVVADCTNDEEGDGPHYDGTGEPFTPGPESDTSCIEEAG